MLYHQTYHARRKATGLRGKAQVSRLGQNAAASPTYPWFRTNGVSTNGAAAEVMNVDRLGKKVRPGTFGNIKIIRSTGVPKNPSVKKHEICSGPISADPICPFPNTPTLASARTVRGAWLNSSFSPPMKAKSNQYNWDIYIYIYIYTYMNIYNRSLPLSLFHSLSLYIYTYLYLSLYIYIYT